MSYDSYHQIPVVDTTVKMKAADMYGRLAKERMPEVAAVNVVDYGTYLQINTLFRAEFFTVSDAPVVDDRYDRVYRTEAEVMQAFPKLRFEWILGRAIDD